MENAINIVNDTLKHEPIFKKEGLAQRQDSDVEDEEEDNTLEGLSHNLLRVSSSLNIFAQKLSS